VVRRFIGVIERKSQVPGIIEILDHEKHECGTPGKRRRRSVRLLRTSGREAIVYARHRRSVAFR
jgi:hypothetical protein